MATPLTQPTEEQVATIARLVAAGNDVYVSATYAGVSRSEVDRWLAYGRLGGGRMLVRFAKEIDKAEAEAEIRDFAVVAQSDNWQAALARLERRASRRQDDELLRLRALTTDR